MSDFFFSLLDWNDWVDIMVLVVPIGILTYMVAKDITDEFFSHRNNDRN
tara:strand:+ start:533 stop:679 length:147 start_codon:yes stop_codon:yes gene_type:complete